MNLLKIVPAERSGDGPKLTNGSQVVLANGTKLEGVVRVEIIGEANNVWKAKIEVLCEPPDFDRILADIAVSAVNGAALVDKI